MWIREGTIWTDVTHASYIRPDPPLTRVQVENIFLNCLDTKGRRHKRTLQLELSKTYNVVPQVQPCVCMGTGLCSPIS